MCLFLFGISVWMYVLNDLEDTLNATYSYKRINNEGVRYLSCEYPPEHATCPRQWNLSTKKCVLLNYIIQWWVGITRAWGLLEVSLVC